MNSVKYEWMLNEEAKKPKAITPQGHNAAFCNNPLLYKISGVTVSSHQRSTVHSILKFVFLEIQNKAIKPVLSGPVTIAN